MTLFSYMMEMPTRQHESVSNVFICCVNGTHFPQSGARFPSRFAIASSNLLARSTSLTLLTTYSWFVIFCRKLFSQLANQHPQLSLVCETQEPLYCLSLYLKVVHLCLNSPQLRPDWGSRERHTNSQSSRYDHSFKCYRTTRKIVRPTEVRFAISFSSKC